MEDAHLRNAVSLYLVGGGSLRGYRDARIGDNPLSKHLQTNYLSLYVSQHNNFVQLLLFNDVRIDYLCSINKER